MFHGMLEIQQQIKGLPQGRLVLPDLLDGIHQKE